ncbi:MAG TPA: hypothetical protein VGB49_01230, partial [Caulobacteraceae bacterium]
EGSCVPVVLDQRLIDGLGDWQGRRIEIRGRRYPRAWEARDTLDVQYGDRFLPAGFCDDEPFVIYAERIRRIS